MPLMEAVGLPVFLLADTQSERESWLEIEYLAELASCMQSAGIWCVLRCNLNGVAVCSEPCPPLQVSSNVQEKNDFGHGICIFISGLRVLPFDLTMQLLDTFNIPSVQHRSNWTRPIMSSRQSSVKPALKVPFLPVLSTFNPLLFLCYHSKLCQ